MKAILTLVAISTAAWSLATTSSYELTRSKATAERGFVATAFSAVARIGDSALCTTNSSAWEMGIGPNTNQWTSTKNTNFRNGASRAFEVNYNAANRQVKFTLDGNILTYNLQPDKKIDGLILSASSPLCSSIRFDSLMFKNEAIGAGLRPNVANCDTKYLRITGADMSKDFSLKGSVAFNWSKSPRNNEMFMEVKGVEAVPEPGTVAAVAAGLTALASRRRKKS